MHEETPLKNGFVCHGLQIFINPPEKLKNTKPKTYHLDNSEAPRTFSFNEVSQIKEVTGQFANTRSLVQTDWLTDLLQLKWLKDGSVKIDLGPGQSVLILNLDETVTINDSSNLKLSKYSGVAGYNKEKGVHEFEITASKGSDIVIIRSQKIDEPSVFNGPFVATNEEEMEQIIKRYHRGDFGKLLPRDEN